MRDIQDFAFLGKTDKRLGHAALKDKDLGFMSAKGTGESDAPGGVSKCLFMGVME